MRALYRRFVSLAESARDVPLLLIRLTLAYGFYEPAKNKLQNFSSVVAWFGDQLGIPFPYLNAVMAVSTEVAGVILLTLGLATRLISIPLIVVMLVAIKTVHLANGFKCSDDGFQIPYYFMLMLMVLVVSGAGRLSVDHLIARRLGERE